MSNGRALAGHRRHARESSPRVDEFHTGYTFQSADVLHSTEHGDFADRDQYATRWSKNMTADDEGSASMSIEFGRGLKRAGSELDDYSSNAAFAIGDNSEYEITKTPPLNSMARKNEVAMKREVSIRRANEGAKRATSHTVKPATDLSDALRAYKMAENTSGSLEVIHNAKNTRFTTRKVIPAAAPSGQTNTPAHPSHTNPRSAADTQDFDLPDVSNIEELVDPAQKDRTFPSKNRSRFTPSATHRMPVRFEGTDRKPVRSVPIPEDEKKIYAALQTLQEKFNQLELNNAEAAEQLNTLENENIDLRNALVREEQLHRPDSAVGSDEETAQENWRVDRTKLKSSLRSVQQRFNGIEHKLKVTEKDLRACTKERDGLIAQLGVECYRAQELEVENAQLRQDHESLRTEVEDLKHEMQALRVSSGRPQAAKDITGTFGHRSNNKRSSRFTPTAPKTGDVTAATIDCINFANFDQQARQQIADAVKQHWQQQQDRQRQQHRPLHSTMFDLKPEKAAVPLTRRQYKTAAVRNDDTDEEIYTEFELTNTKNLTSKTIESANDDLTELTANDPLQVQNLRRLLEEQRRAFHLKRQSSAPPLPQQVLAIPSERRSSLRDLTSTVAHDAQATKRTVRVQSPTLDDQTEADTQTSLLSKIGRRRNSAPREDGETSAFIIPDITLHRKSSLRALETDGAKHDAASCTVCHDEDQDMTVPALEPVSARTDLPEDATVRPSQPPRNALARVVKQLNDELAHLKLVLASYQKQHNANDPAVGANARKSLYDKISTLMIECQRKEDQIYALYDAAEGQADDVVKDVKQRVSTPAARKTANFAAVGLDGAYDDDDDDEESVGLPAWEGLSEDEA